TFRDFVMIRRDDMGRILRVSTVAGEPLLSAAGRILGYRGVSSDITDRYRMQQALRESEDRYRRLSEISTDWYWELDENYRFIETHEFRGRTDERPLWYVGKARWELEETNLTEEQWAAHRLVLETRQPFDDFQYSRKSGDGRVRWVSI